MNRDILIPKSRGRPIGFERNIRIRLSDFTGHRDIGRLVGFNRNILAMQYPCRSSLTCRFAVPLHKTRITGKGDRLAGIALGEMNLQEPQYCTTILEIKRKGFSFFMFAQARERIVQHDHIVWYIRRDPHKRISMDSLQ